MAVSCEMLATSLIIEILRQRTDVLPFRSCFLNCVVCGIFRSRETKSLMQNKKDLFCRLSFQLEYVAMMQVGCIATRDLSPKMDCHYLSSYISFGFILHLSDQIQ
jgi:hypothetical protein